MSQILGEAKVIEVCSVRTSQGKMEGEVNLWCTATGTVQR